MKQHRIPRFFIACLFLASVVYGAIPLMLPKPVPNTGPAEQFSAERAMQHVIALAQAPRVAGTVGMEQAAAYLVDELRSIGYEPEIQEIPSSVGTLRNVVVRIPGSNPGRAVLVITHADSVSFGAGDNASGAAVLLEVARALKAGGTYKSEIILLFEDGEEAGYLGGYAFAKSDPEIENIRTVIGLDTAAWGPVILLQTTPGNAELLNAYAGSVSRPLAFGFFANADWSISKDTSEIQPFYERGISGIEFEDPTAFTGKHTDADRIEMVNQGSLQQAGDQVLSLVRYLGNADLSRAARGDESYFTLWGLSTIHYPAPLNMGLALLSLGGLVILIVMGIKRRGISFRPVLISILLYLLIPIGAFLLGFIGSTLFEKVFPNPNPATGSYLLPASLPFLLVMVACVILVFLLWRRYLANRFAALPVDYAGMLVWVVLAILIAVFLPVGSSVFTLPVFGLIVVSYFPSKYGWLKAIPAVLATILAVPNIVLAFISTGMQTLAIVAVFIVFMEELWWLSAKDAKIR